MKIASNAFEKHLSGLVRCAGFAMALNHGQTASKRLSAVQDVYLKSTTWVFILQTLYSLMLSMSVLNQRKWRVVNFSLLKKNAVSLSTSAQLPDTSHTQEYWPIKEVKLPYLHFHVHWQISWVLQVRIRYFHMFAHLF